MNVSKKCDYCQQPAALMCSRCLEFYCSVECQILDWSEHRKNCFPIPKLCPNASYLDLLTDGTKLPSQIPTIIDKGPIRQVDRGRPLMSALPMRFVEVSRVQRKATDSIPNEEKESLGIPSMKIQDGSNEVEDLLELSNIRLEGVAQSDTGNGYKQNKSVTKDPQILTDFDPDAVQSHKSITSTNLSLKPWMLHFPLKNNGEAFEVVIQHVVPNQPSICWVILSELAPQCNQFLRDINVQVDLREKSVDYNKIQVDDVYTGPYENIYYRVVILEKIDPSKSLVKVRLVDYGNELVLPASDLRNALPQMKELHAFAFRIEIQNMSRLIEADSAIRIVIIRSESDRKIVQMVLKPESLLTLLANSTETTGEGGIVAILSSQKALILLSSAPVLPLMRVLYTQLAEEACLFHVANNSKIGDLVCVNSENFGWSRALVIALHNDNLLVYTVDNGTIELVSARDVRNLPDKYKHHPRMVLAMQITKVLMDEQEFKRTCYMPSFTFTFERMQLNKSRQTITCSMKAGKASRVIAEVDFMDFECDLKKAGIHYWPHTPRDNTIVRILSALDANTIVICSKDRINVYTELLKTMIPKLERLTAGPNVMDIIVAVDNCMKPYRARVLSILTSTEVEVLDLDNGKVRKTLLNQMYETNGFVNNLPVYTLKVRILDMNVSAIKDPVSVLDLLDVFRSEEREFRMHFEGSSYMCGVKLIDVNSNRSLATILLEHHDKKVREDEDAAIRQNTVSATSAKAAAELDRKAPEVIKLKQAETAAPIWLFTINDLKLVGLPVRKSGIRLTILDDDNLVHGIVTVFEFTDENLKLYATLNDTVNEEAAKVGGDGYCPKMDELCIAVFDSDKLWYRAVCLQAEPEKNVFMVQFIDFGNTASVKCESIRSLPKALAFPYVAHTCSVIDHKNVMKTLVKQQASLGYVVAQEIVCEGEQYSLKF